MALKQVLRSGIYNFIVKGHINHHLPSLIPNEYLPRFLQLYFYDTENEVGNRLKHYNIPGESNIILRIEWLLQQYLVDLYVKMRHLAFRFFKDNQQKLRTECYQSLHDAIVDGEVRAHKVGKRVILPTSFIDIAVAYNRPDLTTRLFSAKLEDLKKYVIKGILLGKVTAHVYVIEFQKKGLPQAHMVLIMATNDKIQTIQQVDAVVFVELPDSSYFTQMDNNAINNTWVVPYNSKLLLRYNYHINIEVCSSIKVVEDTIIDEVQEFQQARWVSTSEAACIIFSFDLSGIIPNLLESGNDIENCLDECNLFKMPSALRQLFTTILLSCKLTNDFNCNCCCKTFLYRALLVMARSNNILALPTISLGIAATNVSDGRTTHFMFQIRLSPTQSSMCNITKQSKLANIIKNSRIIIWDETPMMTKYAFEAVDKKPFKISWHAILATRNDIIDELNDAVISIFPGEEHAYCSFDTLPEDYHNLYLKEFLNTLTPSSFPLHMLRLKVGASVILLRNLNPKNSLYSINAIKFKRKQFPIHLAFTMIINKSQGQIILSVGIFLEDYVFAHGQVYVALSRGTTKENTKVYIEEYLLYGQKGNFTKNIVYKGIYNNS
ncbi:hypothetical protein AMTRI_Chr04g184750 [Amborella trichopoda]